MQKNKIVITGNLGFIFSHVTDYFLKEDWEVHGIDNHSAGSHTELIKDWEDAKHYYHYEMDVSDEKVIELVQKINPTYLIHAAAYSDVDWSIATPLDVIKQNTLGNLHLFEAARKLPDLKKFLYVNTDEIFGECDVLKKEEDILFPKNPYAASKATGALFRYAFDNSYPELKDKTVETRFCNIFGPRQDSRKIIPRIIYALDTGEAMPVHNDGKGKREYLWVGNIPPLLEKVLLEGSRTYNITNNDLYSVNEIINMIEKMLDRTVPTTKGHRQGMDEIYQMDSSRVRKEFDWTPKISFKEGLAELLAEAEL